MTDIAPPLHAVLQQLGDLLTHGAYAEALSVAEQAQLSFPAHPELTRLHGVTLLQLGRLGDAARILQRAAELAPENVEIQCNLASLQLQNNDANGAIERLRATLRRSPGHPMILFGLGNALMAEARHLQARESFAMATHRAPDHPGLRLNLAAAELALGNPRQAAIHIDEALQLAPGYDAAYALHGHVLQALGQPRQAAQAWQRAEQMQPRHPQYPFQVGLMLDESGQLSQAAEAYARAWRLDQSSGPALSQWVFAKRRLCDWNGLDALAEQLRQAVVEQRAGITPFGFLAEDASAAEQRRCAATFAAEIELRMEPLRRQLALVHAQPERGAPIRVGFVSNGFGDHPTGLLTVALFEALHGSDLDVHLFATAPGDGGEIRRRLEAATTLHDTSALNHERTAQAIHEAGIEILFDLRGYGGGSNAELFALRPAPVQVNWLAYPGTSGAPWMDYVLADAVVLPPELREGHSEKVVRLPRCFQPNDNTRVLGEAPPRARCGLPEQGTVFASFNNSYKINPAAFARFMLVLRDVPGSVLWLLSGPEGADERLRAAAQALEIDPARLVFLPRMPHAAYLAHYTHADLFLDTLPYGAHTTASDALWAGCPVLTRAGDTFAGRVAASLLSHAGLPELVVESENAFIEMAVDLGRHPEALRTLREHLQQQRARNPLFDMRSFAGDFRRAVQGMSARHRIGRPAADIDL